MGQHYSLGQHYWDNIIRIWDNPNGGGGFKKSVFKSE